MITQETRIALGQAKNQAVSIMSNEIRYITDFEGTYKKYVRNFFKWNSELDAELLNNSDEGLNHAIDAVPHQPAIKSKVADITPSPKQKYCPKCNVIIPKSWTEHRKPEGCGWGVKA